MGSLSGYHAFLFAKQLRWTIPYLRSIEWSSKLSEADNQQRKDRTAAGCQFYDPKWDYKDLYYAGRIEEANRVLNDVHCVIADRHGRACLGCRPPELYPDRPKIKSWERPPGESLRN